MKSLKITRGAFTAAGNVMLMDKQRDAYFCPKSIVEDNKWKSVDDIKFPLYVNVKEFTYNNRNEKGENILNADGTNSTFTRVDVIDVFASAQALADDYADDFALDVLKEQARKSTASTAGLTSQDLERILAVSI
jgi:hypothetical protein